MKSAVTNTMQIMTAAAGIVFLAFACGPSLDISPYVNGFSLQGLENGAVVEWPTSVTLTAVDQEGRTYASFQSPVVWAATNAKIELSPVLGGFVDGSATGELEFVADEADLPLSTSVVVSSGALSWTSPPFMVVEPTLASFSLTAPATAVKGGLFGIKIGPQHQAGGELFGWSGTVALSSSNPALSISPTSISGFIEEDNTYYVYLLGVGTTRIVASSGDVSDESADIQVADWTSGTKVVAQGGWYSDIAVDGENVYIGHLYGSTFQLAKSTDGGVTWSSQSIASKGSGGAGDPGLAVSGDNVYYSRGGEWMGSDAKLFVSRSENGGATWTHTEVDGSGDAQFSCMAVDGTHVYVAYEGELARSDNSGATWPAEYIKMVGTGNEWSFSIAVNGMNVYYSYADRNLNELYVKKSEDRGATWSSTSVTVSAGPAHQNSICVMGGDIYLCYQYYDDPGYSLKITKSEDDGATWGAPVTIDGSGLEAAGSYCALTTDGASLYVSYQWKDAVSVPTQYLWKFAKSVDDGANWSIQTIDDKSGIGGDICVSGSNVYTSYMEGPSNLLKFAKSTDGGINW